MSGLSFDFERMIREIRDFQGVAKTFLDAQGPEVLSKYVRDLELIRAYKPRHSTRWAIGTARPLGTRISEGRYESGDRRGKFHVIAKISSVWEISCPDEGDKKSVEQKVFVLSGLASTTVRLLSLNEDGTELLLASWQTDVGSAMSPGCHFHMQVQRDDNELPFPKNFPVPRFPSLLISSLSMSEFVLSELFQEEWSKHVTSPTDNLRSWSSIQQDRLEKLLCWQMKVVKEARQVSPWTFLKSQKPDSQLLI